MLNQYSFIDEMNHIEIKQPSSYDDIKSTKIEKAFYMHFYGFLLL